MNLKKAALSDIIELQKICVDAYCKNFYNHWNEGGLAWYVNYEFSLERLTSDLSDATIEYYFIEHEQKAAGFIKISTVSTKALPIKNSATIEKIYVLPDYKGMGIGKLALKEIIIRTAALGKENLILAIIDTNLGAIAFYEKLGFQIHSKTILDIPYFKEELKGMNRMVNVLNF